MSRNFGLSTVEQLIPAQKMKNQLWYYILNGPITRVTCLRCGETRRQPLLSECGKHRRTRPPYTRVLEGDITGIGDESRPESISR